MKIPEECRWMNTGKTLGEGGQAQVFLVTDKTGALKGEWALKVLKKSQHRQSFERFVRELTAIRKLNDPGIIRIVDHSQPSDEFQYYVMEYIEGARTLDKVIFIENSQFKADALRSLTLFKHICEALCECESSKPQIVHRDLSPANILLCPDDSIKIIDFGLCQIEGHERITLVDEGIGTVNYMAPECESGAIGEITVSSDLYSAGKILWSAITGFRAFSRENPAFTTSSMPELFKYKPETWHLHHVFERTIRRNAENRWKSASDAVKTATQLCYLIRSGYPPIESLMEGACRICGVGKLFAFEGAHMVFGNPNPPGIISVQCGYCGYCFAINRQLHLQLDQSRKKLD